MTVTASTRLFPSLACTRRRIGHVAMASMTAQMAAGRKGRRISRPPPSKRAMNRTANVVRVRS